MADGSGELTHAQKVVFHAYLMTFANNDFGKIVLDDLRKSYHEKPVPDDKLADLGYLIKREAERGVYFKIIRIMERAAELIQTAEGVAPSHTLAVITDDEEP